MSTVVSSLTPTRAAAWKDVVLPKEHGSWSLALEPIAFGLLIAPSVAGGLLAFACVSGFFARRPLRIALVETCSERRALALNALAFCAFSVAVSGSAIVSMCGAAWLGWLMPTIIAGTIFAYFDRKGAGRAEAAEIAGSAAFAMMPAAIGVLGGLDAWSAVSVSLLALGRSVPSVLCIRAFLRGRKTGVHADGSALITAGAAFAVVSLLYYRGFAPLFSLVCMGVFAVRTFALLSDLQPPWRARTIGMIEAVLGLVFVLGSAFAWRG